MKITLLKIFSKIKSFFIFSGDVEPQGEATEVKKEYRDNGKLKLEKHFKNGKKILEAYYDELGEKDNEKEFHYETGEKIRGVD